MAESMRKQDKKKGKDKDPKEGHHHFHKDKDSHAPESADGKPHYYGYPAQPPSS